MKEVIVITGIAQGMGREVALLLARAGDSVAGFDMDSEGIESLKKELSKIGGDHYLIAMDITDRKGIIKFRNDVLKRYNTVDTVLSNVGIGFFGAFEEIDLEKALKCFEINVIGASAIFQAFIPHMREKRKGKLIAMSSLVGQVPFPFESIYTGTKFAIEGIVQSLLLELKPFGIQMAMIEPAQVSTTFAAKIHWLPEKSSPYMDRVKRFIDKDNELIKTAPDPERAARVMFRVLKTKKLKLRYHIDFMSAFFIVLNKYLPKSVRDFILVNYMDIKP